MRRLGPALLLVAVVALTAAGFGTAARFGVFQSSTPPAGESRLDPEAVGGSGGGEPLPAAACPPEPEPPAAAGSDLTFTGPCAFHQAGPAYCRAAADDFYVLLKRALPGGRSLDLYVDVEFYRGPGDYPEAQTLLLIQDGTRLYTWSNFRTRATVLPREAAVRMEPAELRPEAGRAGSGVIGMQGTVACGAPAP